MNIGRSKHLIAAFAFLALAACADSTGPGGTESDEAMRSLQLGLRGTNLPLALSPSLLGTAAGGIDQIDVTIDGATERMYALGLRVTYPVGTCLESVIVISDPMFPPIGCSPPPLGLILVLWQATSGSRPPDRLVLIAADAGTSSFAIFPTDAASFTAFPAFAIYANGREEFWSSLSGSLISQVTATSQTCSVPPPAFAKSSTCHVATFTEEGRITFERFDVVAFGPGAPPRQTMELVIPSQSVRGILQAITEIRPITIPAL